MDTIIFNNNVHVICYVSLLIINGQ